MGCFHFKYFHDLQEDLLSSFEIELNCFCLCKIQEQNNCQHCLYFIHLLWRLQHMDSVLFITAIFREAFPCKKNA